MSNIAFEGRDEKAKHWQSPVAELAKPPQLKGMRSRFGVLALILFGLIYTGWHGKSHIIRREFDSKAQHFDFFDEAPLIDGHNDFPMWIRIFYGNRIYQDNFTQPENLGGQVDFPRLRQGRLGGQFWSVFVACPNIVDDYRDSVYYESLHQTLQQIDLMRRLIEEYPSHLEHASISTDIERIFDGGSKRISSLIGVEGLHQIANSASILRLYYSLGVRYVTLTHTCHNIYADSESPKTPLHGGISAAGKAMIKEMNRIGMIVDLSHTSADAQRQALALTRAPVIFSHSNAFTLCGVTRNVVDDVLDRLKANGGVIMVTFVPDFLENDPKKATIESVLDHIQYIGERIGYRHVGIGSDFDGIPEGPKGLEDVSKYPDLIRAIHKRGVSRDDILGIMGRNVLRVLAEVERVSESMKRVKPLEDYIPLGITV